MHASAVGGHSGVQAIYQRIKRMFAWHGLKTAVTNFVQQCEVCQHAKHSTAHPQGLLQPLPVPEGAWRDITMDFVEGLPLSEGADVILVVVDRFTKVAHFLPLRHPYTAPQVARVFIDGIVKLHGMPKTITSDRDTIFTSHFWKQLFKALGTKLNYTTAYHPQTDGQSERVNQCLEMFLRCMVQEDPKQWRRWLPLAEFWYNTTVHTSIGCSPFKALYGHEPNLGAMPDLDSTTDQTVTGVIEERAHQVELIKQHLAVAQNRMKLFADRNRTEKSFEVGDKVLLKLQPYAQATVINRPFPKLAYKFFGPYKILGKVGQVSYRLELPEGTKVHNVFHVSQLKEFHPDYTPVFSELPKLPLLDSTDTYPEKILDHRLVKKGNAALPEMLIKWKNLPEDAATWEDWNTLKSRFPEVLAWGQASVHEGEPVTP
jgi:transposase InsO family protein